MWSLDHLLHEGSRLYWKFTRYSNTLLEQHDNQMGGRGGLFHATFNNISVINRGDDGNQRWTDNIYS
jgi:hypothetical protein